MRISRLLLHFAFFIALILIDQISKGCISHPIFNSGFFLGSFQWTSSFYRVFCTIAFLAFSLISLSLIEFLTWKSVQAISLALTALQASILANGMDKIRFGAVRDFISIPLLHRPLILNMADLIQWASILTLLIVIWKHPQRIWHPDNLRNRLLAYPRSQLKLTGVLILITSLVSLANFLIFLGFLESIQVNYSFQELLICFSIFLLLSASVIFLFGVQWTNRIFGPFRAIERYLIAKAAGKNIEVKFRTADDNECAEEILKLLQK